MLQWGHSVILSAFIKLPFVIKIFVLSIFESPLLLLPFYYMFNYFVSFNGSYIYDLPIKARFKLARIVKFCL